MALAESQKEVDFMNKCFIGDCRETMRQLVSDDTKVQTCITSPPYWGLRSYLPDGHESKHIELGLEKTPEEYVANMVEVFHLVRELLADDGTLWLNLGDSYAGSGGPGSQYDNKTASKYKDEFIKYDNPNRKVSGLKPKDLVGIPWMVAFALRADGWYLRSDIIWHKPNPMPESVTDRPTKAHEYLFLLSKSQKYYYNADAIKEDSVDPESYTGRRERNAPTMAKTDIKNLKNAGSIQENGKLTSGQKYEKRNKRSVWTVPTKSYSGAHFATYPPELIIPCILAGSREGDIVLDPFFGSGTTGETAERLGRRWIGCELNSQYEPLQKGRTAQQGFIFSGLSATV